MWNFAVADLDFPLNGNLAGFVHPRNEQCSILIKKLYFSCSLLLNMLAIFLVNRASRGDGKWIQSCVLTLLTRYWVLAPWAVSGRIQRAPGGFVGSSWLWKWSKAMLSGVAHCCCSALASLTRCLSYVCYQQFGHIIFKLAYIALGLWVLLNPFVTVVQEVVICFQHWEW